MSTSNSFVVGQCTRMRDSVFMKARAQSVDGSMRDLTHTSQNEFPPDGEIELRGARASLAEWAKLDDELKDINLDSKKIRLDYLLQYGSRDRTLSRITAEFVGLGIHPFDEVGRKKFDNKPWWDAFVRSAGVSQFSPQLAADQRLALEREIMTNQYELVEDVIFANTFFALEETGLAYPSLSPDASEETRKLDAWLRVLASRTCGR